MILRYDIGKYIVLLDDRWSPEATLSAALCFTGVIFKYITFCLCLSYAECYFYFCIKRDFTFLINKKIGVRSVYCETFVQS